MIPMIYERGDVIQVHFSPVVGSEQAFLRPAVVVSDERFQSLKVITVIALTSKCIELKGRVLLQPDSGNGLDCPSDALAYQVRTISTDPKRIEKKLGRVSHADLSRINKALKLALHLK